MTGQPISKPPLPFYKIEFNCFDAEDRCLKCKLVRNPDGSDSCLGRLPGVVSACCGHGHHMGYIGFDSGLTLVYNGKPKESRIVAKLKLSPEEVAKVREENAQWVEGGSM